MSSGQKEDSEFLVQEVFFIEKEIFILLTLYEWKDRPCLMERLFPVQKISAESFKEQMAGAGKTLTALGSYWKGRKPLILNKACVLGLLLPATEDSLKDLEIFEMLMGMDQDSMKKRLEANLPASKRARVEEVLSLPYREKVSQAKRPEEMDESLFSHIWDKANAHLGTSAHSFPELVEQMGIARFGHRPKLADVFCGSGQIPFEAARLGCDVYASDLNPIACMLTWGAFHIVGANPEKRKEREAAQKEMVQKVQQEIDALDIESDGKGWRAKVYLYCVEIICPETGWKVPLLPSLIISHGHKAIARLVPVSAEKRYEIEIVYVSTDKEIEEAKVGTVQAGSVVHSPDGCTVYRMSLSSIRGDYREGKETKNRLRLWEKEDFSPRPGDIFQERLYCVQWMRKKPSGKGDEYQFRSVTEEDLEREKKVVEYVGKHLSEWQEKGFVPDMVIEKGYNTDQPIRERGWTHWHHLFHPRQLLLGALYRKNLEAMEYLLFGRFLGYSAKLCMWNYNPGPGRVGKAQNTFYNQALNTLYNYACRGSEWTKEFFDLDNLKSFPCSGRSLSVHSHPAQELQEKNDLYITDPPYGDAVKYEEITEFFIAWLRKNPPVEFASWTWDSRRSLAIQGQDDSFRQAMVVSYQRMREKMPDHGMQVLMFTHKSGSIWADMANIIWASGLQVTAAWYVVTETDSALRQGANVTGTVLLVLRKRCQFLTSFRDDLAWEIQEAVQNQVASLVGLDQSVRAQGSEGLYNDADIQMAGYAAAMRVLTSYSKIDGKDMVVEAQAPRQKDKKTFVEELLDFAVQCAVQFLVPSGLGKEEWQKLSAVERFYLKMAELEHQGNKTLDNYQNFAKAFQVHHFEHVMSDSSRANSARLKLSTEFKGSLMSGEAEIAGTPLRALLYALYELTKDVETEIVLYHLMENCPNYLACKPFLISMADYLAQKRGNLKSTKTFRADAEASSARVLAEAMRNQRL